MNVELSTESKVALQRMVQDGEFASVQDALDAAISLLREKNDRWWAGAAPLVDKGCRSIRDGRFTAVTEETKDEFVASIVARARARRETSS